MFKKLSHREECSHNYSETGCSPFDQILKVEGRRYNYSRFTFLKAKQVFKLYLLRFLNSLLTPSRCILPFHPCREEYIAQICAQQRFSSVALLVAEFWYIIHFCPHLLENTFNGVTRKIVNFYKYCFQMMKFHF